jgi:hypothetical protein
MRDLFVAVVQSDRKRQCLRESTDNSGEVKLPTPLTSSVSKKPPSIESVLSNYERREKGVRIFDKHVGTGHEILNKRKVSPKELENTSDTREILTAPLLCCIDPQG